MAFNLPGGFANFVPTAVASLQSTFTQSPSAFPLNQYSQVTPVNQPVGYWRNQDPNAQIRMDYTNGADFVWMPGTKVNVNFAQGNQYVQYSAIRNHQTFVIDDTAFETAAPIYDVLADSAGTATSRLMNWRTYKTLQKATTTGNWNGNTGTATALGGGVWGSATTSNPYIQKTITAAITGIQKTSAALISPFDLCLVISPDTAYAMAESDEIKGMFKSSFVALPAVDQDATSGFWYGLPAHLYGLRVVVEKSVVNTGSENGTPSVAYQLNNAALIVNRPGALIKSQYNTMGTITLAMYEDLNMVVEHDNLNLLSEGNIWDFYDVVLQPATGYLVTAVLS